MAATRAGDTVERRGAQCKKLVWVGQFSLAGLGNTGGVVADDDGGCCMVIQRLLDGNLRMDVSGVDGVVNSSR